MKQLVSIFIESWSRTSDLFCYLSLCWVSFISRGYVSIFCYTHLEVRVEISGRKKHQKSPTNDLFISKTLSLIIYRLWMLLSDSRIALAW